MTPGPSHDGRVPTRLWTELLDLVLPEGCAGCGVPGRAWCARCAAAVGPPRMVRPLPGAPPTVAAGVYAGPLRQALLAYKERGRRGLVDPLAGLLAGAGRRVAAGRCWLVPAPSRPAAARARGGDHVRVLAAALAERLAAGASSCSVGVSPALRMRAGGRDSVGARRDGPGGQPAWPAGPPNGPTPAPRGGRAAGGRRRHHRVDPRGVRGRTGRRRGAGERSAHSLRRFRHAQS